MKKLLALVLSALLLLGCAGCRGNSANGGYTPSGSGGDVNNTPEIVAVKMFEALGKKDMDTAVSCLPEYNINFLMAMCKEYGMEFDEDLSDREAVAQLLNERIFGEDDDNPITDMDLEGTVIEAPVDLIAELRELCDDEDAPEGIDPTLLDEVDEVTWVKVSGTATYEDETTHDDEVNVPCVKIDGKWYADLFSMLMLPNIQGGPSTEIVSPAEPTEFID